MPGDAIATLIGRLRWKVQRFLEQELRDRGIKHLVLSQSVILYWLCREDGPLTMSRLSTHVMRDKSTVTYLVDKLVNEGYALKEKAPYDSRVTYVYPTEKAKGLSKQFNEIAARLDDKLLSLLSPDDARTLAALLSNLDEGFDS